MLIVGPVLGIEPAGIEPGAKRLIRVSLCRLMEARVPFLPLLVPPGMQREPVWLDTKPFKNSKDSRGSAWAGCLKKSQGMMVSGIGREPTPSAWARTRPDVQDKDAKTVPPQRQEVGPKEDWRQEVAIQGCDPDPLVQGCLSWHRVVCPRRCLCCCAKRPRLNPS